MEFNKQSTTEEVNELSKNIDTMATQDILKVINNEDKKVAVAVEKEIPNITKVVDIIVDNMKKGGRLFYVGAGTSGRIGILDASECPPTFGTNPELVQGIMAGGNKAIVRAVEGAEDDELAGRNVIIEKNIHKFDVVIGITASGGAPFVLGAIKQAKEIGAKTVGISNNKYSKIKDEADYAINPIVGPEVIIGSTRMKSGTSQKLILNMITTSVMIKLGKVYGNLMVDLQATNKKLVNRAIRIVKLATDVDEKTASYYLKLTKNNAKKAIVMIKTGTSLEQVENLLHKSDGFISKALDN